MRKNSILTLMVSALSCLLAVYAAQGQTNTEPPAGAVPRGPGVGGGSGFGGFGGGGRGGPPPAWIEAGYNDHSNMMYQLGIKTLRPGKSGRNQNGPGFDEATANDWMPTMPDVLKMKAGTKVTSAAEWPKRRAEILEDFEREVYGRIPANVPKVTWEVTGSNESEVSGVPVITKTLVGHVDNSMFTNISVNIRASFTVPANAPGGVPVLISFGGGGGGFGGGLGGRGAARNGGTNGFGPGGTNAAEARGEAARAALAAAFPSRLSPRVGVMATLIPPVFRRTRAATPCVRALSVWSTRGNRASPMTGARCGRGVGVLASWWTILRPTLTPK